MDYYISSYFNEKFFGGKEVLNIDNASVHLLGPAAVLRIDSGVVYLNFSEDLVELDGMGIDVNLRALLPWSDAVLYNITLASREIDLSNLYRHISRDKKKDGKGDEAVSKAYSYLSANRALLQHINIDVKAVKFKIAMSKIRAVEINIENANIHGVLKDHVTPTFQLAGKIEMDEKKYKLDLLVSLLQDKRLSAKAHVANISNYTLQYFNVLVPQLDGSSLTVDADLSVTLGGDLRPLDAEIVLSKPRGVLTRNLFFTNNIRLSELFLHAACKDDCSVVEIDKILLGNDDFSIKGEAKVNGHLQSANLEIERFDLAKLVHYLPTLQLQYKRHLDYLQSGKLSGHIRFSEDKWSAHLKGENVNFAEAFGSGEWKNTNMKIHYANDEIKVEDITSYMRSMHIFDGKISVQVPEKRADIHLSAAGKAKDIGSMITYFHRKYDLSGDVSGDINLNLDLKRKKVDKIDINAILDNFRLADFYKDNLISDGNAEISFTKEFFKISGVGSLNSVFPLKYDLKRDFKKKDERIGLYFTGEADKLIEDFLSKRLLGYLDGNVGVKMKLFRNNGRFKHVYFDTDISKTVFVSDVLQHVLGKRKVRRMKFDFGRRDVKDGIIKHVRYNYITKDIKSAGGIYFRNMDGRSVLSDVKAVNTINGYKHSFLWSHIEDRDTFELDGEVFDFSIFDLKDLVNFARMARSDGDKGKQKRDEYRYNLLDKDIKIISNFKKIKMHNDHAVTDPRFYFTRSNGSNELRLSGNIDGSIFSGFASGDVFHLSSDDAAGTASALRINTGMHRGELDIFGERAGEEINLRVVMNDFAVKKSSILSKILSLAAVTISPFQNVLGLLKNEGIAFRNGICSLRYSNGNIKIPICEAVGPTFNISGRGTIDLSNDTVQIKGIAVPRNILNSILNYIPFIGEANNPDRVKGAIAVNYEVDGSVSNTNVRVNPLSVLAPGFMRKYFANAVDLGDEGEGGTKEAGAG